MSTNNFSTYVNNYVPLSKSLPYPSINSFIHCTVGGYSGKMASIYFFSEPLDHERVCSMYAAGPNYLPSIYRRQSENVVCASFPWTPETPSLLSATSTSSFNSDSDQLAPEDSLLPCFDMEMILGLHSSF